MTILTNKMEVFPLYYHHRKVFNMYTPTTILTNKIEVFSKNTYICPSRKASAKCTR